jgi:hypothetical protein
MWWHYLWVAVFVAFWGELFLEKKDMCHSMEAGDRGILSTDLEKDHQSDLEELIFSLSDGGVVCIQGSGLQSTCNFSSWICS